MKQILTIILVCLSLLVVAPLSALAENPAKGAVECGVNGAAGQQDCTTPKNPSTDLNSLLKKIINVVSVLVGAVAVVMIVIGGFRYVTSAGSDSGTAAARKTIIYAIVGLIVSAMAQIIVHFVLNNTT